MPTDPAAHYREHGYAVIPGVFAELAELAEAFERIRAEALARGRSWRNRNVFFRMADDPAKGRIVRYVQWPGWIDATLEKVRRDPRLLAILAPLIGRDLK